MRIFDVRLPELEGQLLAGLGHSLQRGGFGHFLRILEPELLAGVDRPEGPYRIGSRDIC